MDKYNNEEKELQELNFYSDEVQEIFGTTPNAIIRWGMPVIFVILILILFLSAILKYPDIINCSITVTAINPPAKIVPKINGRIEKLFVTDGESVPKDALICLIENEANYDDVIKVRQEVKRINRDLKNQTAQKFSFPSSLRLGLIQQSYGNLVLKFKEYLDSEELQAYEKRIKSAKKQLTNYLSYRQKLVLQEENLMKIVQLNHKQFTRDSILFHKKVISPAELDASERKSLEITNTLVAMASELDRTELQINDVNTEIINLENERVNKFKLLDNLTQDALTNFEHSVVEWEKLYVLKSPIAGTISFAGFWSTNQLVESGDMVCTVIPSNLTRIIGKAKVPVDGSGKVLVGQDVLIKLFNYPYVEYGMLKGKISHLSLVSDRLSDGSVNYTADVELPNGLLSTYLLKLPYSGQLEGTAEIVTKKYSVFERFFSPLKAIISKSTL